MTIIDFNEHTQAPYKIFRDGSDKTMSHEHLRILATSPSKGFRLITTLFAMHKRDHEIPSYKNGKQYCGAYYSGKWMREYLQEDSLIKLGEVKDSIRIWYRENWEWIDEIWTFPNLDYCYYLAFFVRNYKRKFAEIDSRYFDLVIYIAKKINDADGDFLDAPPLLALEVVREYRNKSFPKRIRRLMKTRPVKSAG